MKVLFNVSTVRPDMRQFRQNALELFPHDELCVEIDLDATREPFAEGQEPTPFVISLETLKGLADRFDLLFAGASSEDGWEENTPIESASEEDGGWEELQAEAPDYVEDEW